MPKASKRALFAFLLLPMLALLGACGGNDDSTSPTSAPATTTGSSSERTAVTGTTTTSTGGSNATAQKLNALEVPYEMADGYFLGSPAAKVTLTVYEDFQCPHCLNFTANTEPTLINDYVKTGKIKLQFQNMPILGQESVLAAFAAHCAAEQDLFWQLHSKLFLVQAEANQLTDEKSNVGRFVGENLTDYADEIGADGPAFSTCLQAQTTVDALTQQVKDAQTLGFRGTPSFAINGVAQSGQPSTLAGWRKLLDEAVAAAK